MSANVHHSSETADWGSPVEVVELTRELFGGNIDLDPASSLEFNRIIKADSLFDKQSNGYLQVDAWAGKVFLNPPGGHCDVLGREVHRKTKTRESCTVTGSCGLPPGHTHESMTSSAKAWWRKLQYAWRFKNVAEAVFICFDLGLLQTTQVDREDGVEYLPLEFPICYPMKRLAYLRPDGSTGESPPHPSCIVYLPSVSQSAEACDALRNRFRVLFSKLGHVVVPG